MAAQTAQPPDRLELAPGTQLHQGAYEVGPVLGRGGFSITYLGRERRLKSEVAIKEFFPAGCERQAGQVHPGARWAGDDYKMALQAFLREGQILERFNHPGIVRVYAVFEENSTAYMVMELLKGESLGLGVARRGPMTEGQALEVGKAVASALSQVHLAGLLHSDLKPENVLRTEDGRLVLLDFGTSRGYLTSRSRSQKQLLTVTPGYSPPEQYQRRASLTPRADIYALAATIYNLLAARVPTPAHERMQGAPVIPLRQLNSTVSEIVAWAIDQGMHMEVDKRPETVTAFLEMLVGEGKSTAAEVHTGLSGVELACLTGHSNWVMGLDISPDGSLLTSASRDGSIRLWSLPAGQLLGVLDGRSPALNCVRISPDGRMFASGGQDGAIRIWDLSAGRELLCMKEDAPPVQDLRWSADGRFLVAGLTDGTVMVYGPSGTPPKLLQGHEGPVNAVDCSGPWVASGSNDRTIRLWDLDSGKLLRTFEGHDRMVQTVRFSPDGRVLASGSNDLTVRIWDPLSGEEIRRMKGHGALVWCVNFAPDPKLLLTGSGDRTVRIFRIDSGREVLQLEGHTSWVRTLACSPTMPMVASGGGDNTVRLLGLSG